MDPVVSPRFASEHHSRASAVTSGNFQPNLSLAGQSRLRYLSSLLGSFDRCVHVALRPSVEGPCTNCFSRTANLMPTSIVPAATCKTRPFERKCCSEIVPYIQSPILLVVSTRMQPFHAAVPQWCRLWKRQALQFRRQLKRLLEFLLCVRFLAFLTKG
jgi:hypothetical protein